ncbi:adenosine deaminase [Talaromyces proteolyticus]|uniref:Adenosine deaminase n=1 Tax=Talaromyces proteolyticus TaxID=1131652 RepID=A0AAD4L159_9EURO|nr:adenosine deaminase [Talaromyces proteolyticus]KAH8705647.1 adenosine deaminase [Talaromyces proteolyticus]
MLPDTSTWLRGIPKAELHIHLEGSIKPETLVKLSQRHDQIPLTLEQAQKLYIYNDFQEFLEAFSLVNSRLQTPEDFALITYEMIRSLASQGCVHAEVNFSWGILLRRKPHLQMPTVMQAIETARIHAEQEFGTTVLWIVDLVRTHSPELNQNVLQLAITLKGQFPSIVGVGIGGDEAAGPAPLFRELYAEAKDSGLRLVAHAGEAVGPESIWAALDIGTERIGHGLSAQCDRDLMRVLAERKIPIEINVTSNLKTGNCPALEDHPIRQYFDAGLVVIINSDDPPMFKTSLLQEYELVQNHFSFSEQEMKELAANSVIASFMPFERKNKLLEMIRKY